MKVTEQVRGKTEYISVLVMPLQVRKNGNGIYRTLRTGKQESFQIRDKGAKDVHKIKEIMQYLITLGGVMSIYKELKKNGFGFINGSISFPETNKKVTSILTNFAIEVGIKVEKSKYNKALDKAKKELGRVVSNDLQNNRSQ